MKIEKIAIEKIKLNEKNPRLIKDENFKKLTQSIKDFPEMLDIRPIIVNKDNMILGGNMRYKASVEAGLKEVPILKAINLTPKQEKEFLIKDNVSSGVWDFDALSEDWDIKELIEFGVDMDEYNWDELDYIDEKIETPNPNKNEDLIVVTLSEEYISEKDTVIKSLKEFLSENFSGCEIK